MLDDIADRGWPLFEPGVDSDSAQAALAAAGLGDGLPLVVPTATRFAGMLEVCGLQTPCACWGTCPLEGVLTPAAIAYLALNRANACIGRALHLVLTHVGGAIPGSTDMATNRWRSRAIDSDLLR